MNKRLFLMLFVVALAAALFRDIRLWRSSDADAWQAYNRGISRYRQGDFVAALGDFQAPPLRRARWPGRRRSTILAPPICSLPLPAGTPSSQDLQSICALP